MVGRNVVFKFSAKVLVTETPDFLTSLSASEVVLLSGVVVIALVPIARRLNGRKRPRLCEKSLHYSL